MEIQLKKVVTAKVAFIEVSAEVRYWEDAIVNGVEDTDGKLIPLRTGDLWQPVIDLHTGAVKNWPAGTTAAIHYKVCDQGEYWLQDQAGQRVAKWSSHYVPDDILCPTAQGFGDYIILEIDGDGKIDGWRPSIDSDQWEAA